MNGAIFAAAANEETLSRIAGFVLVGYLLVLIVLGVVGWMRSRATEEDFYLAGRGQGFLVTVMTIMATFFSSAAILGIPGNVYKDGVAFVLFAMNLPVAGVCIYLLGSRIRRIGRRRGYVTQGDMISDYYGDSFGMRGLVALIGFLYVLPYVVMQIKAGGYLAQGLFPEAGGIRLFGRDLGMFELGATALSIVTMVYVLIGGMRSVAWTDVLQGCLLLGGMLLAAVATIVTLGGPSGYFAKVSELPPEAMSLPGPSGTWTPWKLMTVCLFASVGSLVQPGQWIRLYAARDDRTLKRSSLVFAIVLPSCFLFGIMLVALAGRAIYPPEVTGDGIFPHPHVGEFDQIVIVMIKEQLPALLGTAGLFLVSLIVVAVLAASMSTADSNLHALSAVFTRDLYDRFLRPRSSQRERAWVSRVVIVLATLLALGLVTGGHRNEDFAPLRMIADLMFAAIAFSCQLLPATFDMLFFRKGTKAGVMSGMVAGILVVFLFTPLPAVLLGDSSVVDSLADATGLLKSLFDIGFCAVVVNVIVFVAVSRFTRPLEKQDRDAFARDISPHRSE